jgi:hypothetical protein
MTRDRVRGEVGLGGRTPNVSAQFWKDAGIGGQQVIEAIIVSSGRFLQQTLNRICAIWSATSSFCENLEIAVAAGVSPAQSKLLQADTGCFYRPLPSCFTDR